MAGAELSRGPALAVVVPVVSLSLMHAFDHAQPPGIERWTPGISRTRPLRLSGPIRRAGRRGSLSVGPRPRWPDFAVAAPSVGDTEARGCNRGSPPATGISTPKPMTGG
ncbi:hypothetical protein Stube_39450 [Streptomyces tubercidicus]|uniref:Uncharacterized protein n=1 Tax=Streptomyces tubercidicus TaxID=47759 RepID=A0A640UV95_9ACTN|nr:hypothetical protein Stube_39450 [Streptomyces tubercidicus]